jgi:hypothetical protein
MDFKNFVVDGSERSVKDIISKLKFISKIQIGEKVDVPSLTLSPDGFRTRMYRTWRSTIAGGESRDETLQFFCHTIGEAFDLASRYLNSNDKFFQDIGRILVQSIRESKTGIINHSETYKSDKMHLAEVETFLLTVDTKLNSLASIGILSRGT